MSRGTLPAPGYGLPAGAHEIRRYDARTGTYVDTFVQDHPDNPLRAGFDPQHFAFGADGHLYVAGESSDRVLRYDGATGAYLGDLVSPADGFQRPSGISRPCERTPRRRMVRCRKFAGRDGTLPSLARQRNRKRGSSGGMASISKNTPDSPGRNSPFFTTRCQPWMWASPMASASWIGSMERRPSGWTRACGSWLDADGFL